MLTAPIRSSATGCSRTRPPKPGWSRAIAPCGASAPRTGDGRCSARSARNAKKAGPAAHEGLVLRQFRLWLWDITEHPTAEAKAYLCAIKGVYSNPIVRHSLSDGMTSRIAVNALASVVQRHRDVAGCVVHSIRTATSLTRGPPGPGLLRPGPIDGAGRLYRRQRRDGAFLLLATDERREPALRGPPGRA